MKAAPLLAVFAILALAAASPARAEFKIRYPIVDYREFEFEHNGAVTFDRRGSPLNTEQSYTNEIGYGVFPWWEPEIEGEWAAAPGQNLSFDATSFENTFVPFPQGKYWADLGFFAEYSQTASRDGADSFTFGPLIQKETDVLGLDLLHTANLLFTKEVGRNHSSVTPVLVSWQTRARLGPLFEPGVEYYGQLSPVATPTSAGNPQHRIGPVVVGLYNMYRYGKIRYEVGFLFGLNRATEQGAVRWRLEYEKPF
jgi:hypothetical protein